MQWFSKHVSNIEAVFSMDPCKGVVVKTNGAAVQF
jgi:hypothetical protein